MFLDFWSRGCGPSFFIGLNCFFFDGFHRFRNRFRRFSSFLHGFHLFSMILINFSMVFTALPCFHRFSLNFINFSYRNWWSSWKHRWKTWKIPWTPWNIWWKTWKTGEHYGEIDDNMENRWKQWTNQWNPWTNWKKSSRNRGQKQKPKAKNHTPDTQK